MTCPDCGTPAYCPGLPCKSCGMETHARLQRDRDEYQQAGRVHPVDVPAKVKERPGFEGPSLGYSR